MGRAMDKAGIGRRFAGRAGILTGAASGIGRATALRLSAEGRGCSSSTSPRTGSPRRCG
ncbi:hypothetical protein ACFQXA_26145 [Nocardiopsis composta]